LTPLKECGRKELILDNLADRRSVPDTPWEQSVLTCHFAMERTRNSAWIAGVQNNQPNLRKGTKADAQLVQKARSRSDAR
jgi:hypothetical protein